jgi:hypothetical protein
MRAVLLLLLLTACGNAFYSRTQARAGQALDLDGARPATKAEALALLGPPLESLPGQHGDLFVWRLRRTDVRSFNLNTGWFTGVAVPLYADVDGARRDVVLYLAFDAEGRVIERAVSGGLP